MLRSGVARVVTNTSRCFTAKATDSVTQGATYHGEPPYNRGGNQPDERYFFYQCNKDTASTGPGRMPQPKPDITPLAKPRPRTS